MPRTLKFEWEESKRRENIEKHGIDFKEAMRIFDGPRLEDFDHAHSATEDRYWALGILDMRVVKVVYAVRAGVVRLISAFDAGAGEAEAYFGQFFGEPIAGNGGHGKRKGKDRKGK